MSALSPTVIELIGKLEDEIMQRDAKIAELSKRTVNKKKLSPVEARRIRTMHATGQWTHQELADSFDVNRATVSRIINGTYYANA